MTFPFRLHTGWLRLSGLVWQLDGAKESDFYRCMSVLFSSLLLSSLRKLFGRELRIFHGTITQFQSRL